MGSGTWEGWKSLCVCSLAQPRPTLHDPVDCSLPGSVFVEIFIEIVLTDSVVRNNAKIPIYSLPSLPQW